MTRFLRLILTVFLCLSFFVLGDFSTIMQTAIAQTESRPTDRTDDGGKTGNDGDDESENDDDTKDDAKDEDDDEASPSSRARLRRSSSQRERPDDVGPASGSPLLAMEVRDDKQRRDLREHGEEACIEAETRLAEFEKLLVSNKGRQIDPEELGTTLIPVMHVDRCARRLAILGEPSGWELGARHSILLQRLRKAVEQWRRLPGIQQGLSNTAPLQRVARRGEAQLAKVDQLSRKGKFDAAETLMDDILDSVHSVGILYPGEVSTSILTNINGANSTAQAVFTEWRRKEALSEMKREVERREPDFKKLLKELQEATAAIVAGNDPQVGSRSMSGPEFLDHFSERWQHEYFEANRCFGIGAAALTVASVEKLSPSDNIVADYEQFVAAALRGIAELVRADAGRTSAETAPALYAAYLQSIARFAALGDVAMIERALLPSLDAVVVKSPELQADAAAYYTFSTELLRWRQRVADGNVAAKTQRYQGVNGAFYQAVPDASQSGNRVFEPNSLGTALLLSTHAPEALGTISPAIIAKKVYAEGGLASRSERRRVTSYEQGSVYASIPQDVDLSPVVEELKVALLIGETQPPLTLDAALAIETASKGDLWHFGGEVTDVELEGRITKLTNAGPDDWGLFYLTMPMQQLSRSYSLQHVIAHCHLRPDWLRHRYFFVELN